MEKREGVSWNLKDVEVFTLLDTTEHKGKLLKCRINNKQLHIYTNTDLIKDINEHFNTSYNFNLLFNELFKPSTVFQARINETNQIINERYVSCSLRFVNLLGDFHEKGSKELDKEQQVILIDQCISEIYRIKERNPQVGRVLVTADSMKFIRAASNLDFVYIIPGTSGHSGYNSNSDVMMKTMLDFIFISKAEKVYLIKGRGMYASHFAETAASCSGVEFVKIEC